MVAIRNIYPNKLFTQIKYYISFISIITVCIYIDYVFCSTIDGYTDSDLYICLIDKSRVYYTSQTNYDEYVDYNLQMCLIDNSIYHISQTKHDEYYDYQTPIIYFGIYTIILELLFRYIL